MTRWNRLLRVTGSLLSNGEFYSGEKLRVVRLVREDLLEVGRSTGVELAHCIDEFFETPVASLHGPTTD